VVDLTAAQHRSLPRPIDSDSRAKTGPGLTGSGVGLSARHLRVARWQGDPYTALVGPARIRRGPTVAEIKRCLSRLDRRGVQQAVTPALNAVEAEPFFQAGFTLYERLHLLARNLSATTVCTMNRPQAEPAAEVELVRARRWHRRIMLDIDAKAFKGFWRFDDYSLGEALKATPHSYARLARVDGRYVGYAVTGRTESRGYLQRLAVDPAHQGRGVGTTLVEDSSNWLRRRGVVTSLVNTQETNKRALDLYIKLGFIQQREGLMVLRWDRDT
jgi:ribosomal protein S18 acetylase RimI-like enzyme